jgi:hypothetical protein
MREPTYSEDARFFFESSQVLISLWWMGYGRRGGEEEVKREEVGTKEAREGGEPQV